MADRIIKCLGGTLFLLLGMFAVAISVKTDNPKVLIVAVVELILACTVLTSRPDSGTERTP